MNAGRWAKAWSMGIGCALGLGAPATALAQQTPNCARASLLSATSNKAAAAKFARLCAEERRGGNGAAQQAAQRRALIEERRRQALQDRQRQLIEQRQRDQEGQRQEAIRQRQAAGRERQEAQRRISFIQQQEAQRAAVAQRMAERQRQQLIQAQQQRQAPPPYGQAATYVQAPAPAQPAAYAAPSPSAPAVPPPPPEAEPVAEQAPVTPPPKLGSDPSVFGVLKLGAPLNLPECSSSLAFNLSQHEVAKWAAAPIQRSCVSPGDASTVKAAVELVNASMDTPGNVRYGLVGLDASHCPDWLRGSGSCVLGVAILDGWVASVGMYTGDDSFAKTIAKSLTGKYKTMPGKPTESDCQNNASARLGLITRKGTKSVWQMSEMVAAYWTSNGQTCEQGKLLISTQAFENKIQQGVAAHHDEQPKL